MVHIVTFSIVVIVTLMVQIALGVSRNQRETKAVAFTHGMIAVGALVGAFKMGESALTTFVLFMYLWPNLWFAGLICLTRRWQAQQDMERSETWLNAEARVKALETRMERRRMPISNTTR